jgi:hypothetical protein
MVQSPSTNLIKGMAAVQRLCRNRRAQYAGRSAGISLLIFGLLAAMTRIISRSPTRFWPNFQRSIGLPFSPDLLGMTLEACQKDGFCSQVLNGTAGKCTMKYPLLVVDIHAAYVDFLGRSPDVWGLEWWCKKIVDGDMEVATMRMKMLKSAERKEKKNYLKSSMHDMWADLARKIPMMPFAKMSPAELEPEIVRQLTTLQAGDTNVAALSRKAMVGSSFWESAARTIDEIFCEKLCRFPSSMGDTRGNHQRLISWMLSPGYTAEVIANELGASDEAQWCTYRRAVEAMIGLSPDKTEEVGSEGCFLPQESYLPPDPQQERICAPVFEAVRAAVARNLTRVRDMGLLRTREGKKWAQAEDFVRKTHLQLLGRLPDSVTVNHHVADMLSWRRSEETVRHVVSMLCMYMCGLCASLCMYVCTRSR